MKYTKTKYPNIFTYETTKGKRYYIRRSFMINGKKKEVTKSNLKTLTEARTALSLIEKQIDDGDFHTNKNLTVDQYWEKYYEKKIRTGQWTPDTEAFKVSCYNKHFAPQYGKFKLKDLDRDDYEKYIADKLQTHSRHTVRQLHGVFMAILNDAVACGNLQQNILQKIYIGDSQKEAKNKKLTLEQFKTIDQTARELFNDYDYTIFRCTYFGLRRSEVAGLQVKSPQLRSDGRIQLNLTSSRTQRREDKEMMKTASSHRTVVLDLETSQLMQKAIQVSHETAKSAGRILSPDDYLFLVNYPNKRRKKGLPISTNRLPALFKLVTQAAGIYVTPHMMRHFFATQGVLSGVPIEHMAAALGHSTSYMTEKYTHIQEEVSASVTDNFLKAIK